MVYMTQLNLMTGKCGCNVKFCWVSGHAVKGIKGNGNGNEKNNHRGYCDRGYGRVTTRVGTVTLFKLRLVCHCSCGEAILFK